MTEDRDKWRKYVHGVANPRIEDGKEEEQELAIIVKTKRKQKNMQKLNVRKKTVLENSYKYARNYRPLTKPKL